MIVRDLLHRSRRLWGRATLRTGPNGKVRPLSASSGFDRGTPIDRYYIAQFLEAHADDVHGRVLEVGDCTYSRRYGGGRISHQDVLHVDGSNPEATIVGDLGAPGVLSPKTYDCMIVTQTLQYVFDPAAAVKQLRNALRPGGILLLTAPGVAPISLDAWRDDYYWRFTAASIQRLLATAFDAPQISVQPFGNLYAATAFLHGAAAEEVSAAKLQPPMPEYAVVIAARAVA